VLKQADVVLALFLQGELFTAEQKLADFEYYDPITTGDSTLSAVVQSIMAAEVGYSDLARRYFVNALFVDLADRHHNTADGVHVASAGGVWSALVYGFGGFRDHGGRFTFDPRLPEDWSAITFRLTIEGTQVRVTVRQAEMEFAVEHSAGGGEKVDFEVRGVPVQVTSASPVTVPLADQGPRSPGEPRPVAGRQRADGTVIGAIVPGT
jgi:alpha,alpha-trehalose phosphorylase